MAFSLELSEGSSSLHAPEVRRTNGREHALLRGVASKSAVGEIMPEW